MKVEDVCWQPGRFSLVDPFCIRFLVRKEVTFSNSYFDDVIFFKAYLFTFELLRKRGNSKRELALIRSYPVFNERLIGRISPLITPQLSAFKT